MDTSVMLQIRRRCKNTPLISKILLVSNWHEMYWFLPRQHLPCGDYQSNYNLHILYGDQVTPVSFRIKVSYLQLTNQTFVDAKVFKMICYN